MLKHFTKIFFLSSLITGHVFAAKEKMEEEKMEEKMEEEKPKPLLDNLEFGASYLFSNYGDGGHESLILDLPFFKKLPNKLQRAVQAVIKSGEGIDYERFSMNEEFREIYQTMVKECLEHIDIKSIEFEARNLVSRGDGTLAVKAILPNREFSQLREIIISVGGVTTIEPIISALNTPHLKSLTFKDTRITSLKPLLKGNFILKELICEGLELNAERSWNLLTRMRTSKMFNALNTSDEEFGEVDMEQEISIPFCVKSEGAKYHKPESSEALNIFVGVPKNEENPRIPMPPRIIDILSGRHLDAKETINHARVKTKEIAAQKWERNKKEIFSGLKIVKEDKKDKNLFSCVSM